MDNKALVNYYTEALSDKKATNIKVIDISSISILADYLIIASGNNKNQIQAMADNVLEKMHALNIVQKSLEGYDNANWILIDAEDIIIHLFDKESREFYDIERLYQDGKYI